MKRVFTGIVIALLVVIAFLLREINLYLFDICIGVVSVFASLEVAKLLHKANRKNLLIPSLIFPSLAYILLLLGINWKWSIGTLLIAECLLVIAFFIIILVVELFRWNLLSIEKKMDKFEGSTFSYLMKICLDTLFGLIYPTLFLLCFVFINHIDGFTTLNKISSFSSNLGFILLLFTIIISVVCDIASLYVGQLFKGKKLAPNISPNKTISGAIGGSLCSIIFAIVLYLIACSQATIAYGFEQSGISIYVIAIYGLIASLSNQFGDLFESKLKRMADVKDSGNILPGHGGLMDRLDGVSFNALFTLVFFALILL